MSASPQRFILVGDSEEEWGTKLELPLDADQYLPMATLQAAFAGATGLKYKNVKTGAFRALAVDASSGKIMSPSDGWNEDILYMTIQQPVKQAMGASGSIAEPTPKRKMLSSEDDGIGNRHHKIGNGHHQRRSPDGDRDDHLGPQSASKQKRLDLINDEKELARGPTSTKLFVGRITNNMTNAVLKDAFDDVAKRIDPKSEVTDVFIPQPFRAFAFITLNKPEVCQQLIKRHEILVNNTMVMVGPATPKSQHGAHGNYGSQIGEPVDKFLRYESAYTSAGGGTEHGSAGYGITMTPGAIGAAYGSQQAGGYKPMGAQMQTQVQWTPPHQSNQRGAIQHQSNSNAQWVMDPNQGYGSQQAYHMPPPNVNPGGPNSSAQLASGIDALNLNNMPPDVVSAAWQAFWQTIHSRSSNNAPPQGAIPQGGAPPSATGPLPPGSGHQNTPPPPGAGAGGSGQGGGPPGAPWK